MSTAVNTQVVSIPALDGTIDATLFMPAQAEPKSPAPAVLFYMDAIAIRPALFAMAARIAENGYAVLLPNLYYRLGATGSYPPFDPKILPTNPAERERMMAMQRSLTRAGVMDDTRACLTLLKSRADVATATVGCVGYCMGGGMALTAAATFPEHIVAAATFHGGALATDNPDSPHLLAPRIRARLHIGVAELDHLFSAAEGARLTAALTAADCNFAYELYPAVKHGFAVTGHSNYNAAQSERHWDHLLALFKATLAT